jgi:hypothetical protein
MHASGASPFGIIDFAENHPSLLQSSAVPGGVVGGPPAYLEAHGIRYVPCDQALESSLVSMASGDTYSGGGGGSLDTTASVVAPVSPRELNSRVDSRIRRFMSGSSGGAGGMRAAYGREDDDEHHAGVNERLRNLRRECEVASSRGAGPGASLDAEATSSRLRKLRQDAERVGGIGTRAPGSRRAQDVGYDF